MAKWNMKTRMEMCSRLKLPLTKTKSSQINHSKASVAISKNQMKTRFKQDHSSKDVFIGWVSSTTKMVTNTEVILRTVELVEREPWTTIIVFHRWEVVNMSKLSTKDIGKLENVKDKVPSHGAMALNSKVLGRLICVTMVKCLCKMVTSISEVL